MGKSNRIDAEFIGRPLPPSSSQTNVIPMPSATLSPASPAGLPDVFDPARIQHELQKVAGTPGVAKLIAVLRARFDSRAERATLEAWEKFYSQAQKTVQSH